MIQNVLSSIGGVSGYGVVSVSIFFVVFLSVLVWAFALRRPYLDHMSRLPLEHDDPAPRYSPNDAQDASLSKRHE